MAALARRYACGIEADERYLPVGPPEPQPYREGCLFGFVSAAEQGEHGEDAAVHVWRWLQAELAEQLGAGCLDGSFADAEFAGDARVGATLGHQGEDLSFAGVRRVSGESGRFAAGDGSRWWGR